MGNLKVGQSLNPHDFILEVVMTVHGVFDSSFIDVTNGMMAALQALGLGGNRGELAEDLLGVGLPSLQQHRKILKAISLSFGNNVSNAQTFVLHRTVSRYYLMKTSGSGWECPFIFSVLQFIVQYMVLVSGLSMQWRNIYFQISKDFSEFTSFIYSWNSWNPSPNLALMALIDPWI